MTAPDHVADPIISSLRLGGRPHMTHIPSPHATDFVNHVSNYVPGAQLKDRIGALETRKTELTERLAEAHEPPPLLHPNMAEMYRQKVTELAAALGHPESRLEAAELLRTLVERIVLTPENGTLSITLRGDLAGILALAEHKTKKPGSNKGTGLTLLAQESLVAGAGFEPAAFRL